MVKFSDCSQMLPFSASLHIQYRQALLHTNERAFIAFVCALLIMAAHSLPQIQMSQSWVEAGVGFVVVGGTNGQCDGLGGKWTLSPRRKSGGVSDGGCGAGIYGCGSVLATTAEARCQRQRWR
jgi:hypothetical protein